ncbi:MAG TPA: LPS export ABC transporter periplasmic protein LptC [bacterium]|nr:LPS export ABC transporter periplasmic protein LptC [bacterium]
MKKPKIDVPVVADSTGILLAPARKDYGRLFILLGILAAVSLAMFLLREKSQPLSNSPETVAQDEDSPDAIIDKFHLVSSFKGIKRWELYSDIARLYQTQKLAYSDNIYAQYYKDNKLVSTLTADKAIINTETNATEAEGHVVLVTENESRLDTDKLNWNPDTDEIKTDEKVHVLKGSNEITAVGMVADTELNNIQFTKDVHSKVRDVNDIEDYQKPKPF